ncbi:hypothetical protein [Corallococcus sp. AB011P]|uniref:hypothetical protein n=1 Tax=Corallococcus sp. AB011P TaxID=2316735 RepID=UPI001F3117E4|nr:hypothetical protein [Corallococcus sp. AB011P]
MLARVPRIRQSRQQLHVDIAELLASNRTVEINLIDHIEGLPQSYTRVHAVVGVREVSWAALSDRSRVTLSDRGFDQTKEPACSGASRVGFAET